MASTLLPTSTLAQLVGISETRVAQLTRAGILHRAERGRYPITPLPTTARIYEGCMARVIGGREVALLREKIAIARIERQRLEGTLMPADETERGWASMFAIVRTPGWRSRQRRPRGSAWRRPLPSGARCCGRKSARRWISSLEPEVVVTDEPHVAKK